MSNPSPGELMQRYFDEALSEHESQLFTKWLKEDPQHQRMFVELAHLDFQLHDNFCSAQSVKELLADNADRIQSRTTHRVRRSRNNKLPKRKNIISFMSWPVALAACLFLMFYFLGVFKQQDQDSFGPSIVSIHGDIIVDNQVLQIGDYLPSGISLRIDAGQFLRFAYDDGTQCTLTENSVATLENHGLAKIIRLDFGAVQADIRRQDSQHPMRFLSDFGQAIVRGTELQWVVSAEKVRLNVQHGLVEIVTKSADQRAMVSAGNAAEINNKGELLLDSEEQIIRQLKQGLIGYWSFDDEKPLDSSAFQSHGVLRNGARIEMSAGKKGGAAFFDGKDDYILIGDGEHLRLQSAMTLSAWIKPLSVLHAGRIINKQGRSGERGWSLNIEGFGSAAFQVAEDDNRLLAMVRPRDAQPNIMIDEWVHIAGVFTPGEPMRLYINGVLDNESKHMDPYGREKRVISESSYAMRHENSSLPVAIGKRPIQGKSQSPFHGYIDEVRIYNRSLSTEEIEALSQ